MSSPDRALQKLLASPQETRGRFKLLALAAVIVVWSLGNLIAELTTTRSGTEILAYAVARLEGMTLGSDSGPPRRPEDLSRAASIWLIKPLLGVFLFLVTSALLYLWHPLRIRFAHRRHLVPEEKAQREAATVMDFIQGFSAKIGRSRPPTVLFSSRGPKDPAGQAQAFGLRNREIILLHGSPKHWETGLGDDPVNKPTILHEFGHIANRDTQTREGTRAIWLALSLVVTLSTASLLLPELEIFAAGASKLPRGASRFFPVFQIILLMIAMRVIWAGLIRSREFHADWRAAAWGMHKQLQRIFKSQGTARPGLWKRIWDLHPSFHERKKVLEDPSRLFAVTYDIPLAVGFLIPSLFTAGLPIILLGIFLIVETLEPLDAVNSASPSTGGTLVVHTIGVGLFTVFFVIVFLAVSYLITRTIGLQVQREATADLTKSHRSRWGYTRLLRPAALFVLGIVIGFRCAPVPSALAGNASPSFFISTEPLSLTLELLWSTGAILLFWGWLVYVRAVTRMTLGNGDGVGLPCWMSCIIRLGPAALLTILSAMTALMRWKIPFAVSYLSAFQGAVVGDPQGEFHDHVNIPLLVLGSSLFASSILVGVTLFIVWCQLPQRESTLEFRVFRILWIGLFLFAVGAVMLWGGVFSTFDRKQVLLWGDLQRALIMAAVYWIPALLAAVAALRIRMRRQGSR